MLRIDCFSTSKLSSLLSDQLQFRTQSSKCLILLFFICRSFVSGFFVCGSSNNSLVRALADHPKCTPISCCLGARDLLLRCPEQDMLTINPFPTRRHGADGQTYPTRRLADIDKTWTQLPHWNDFWKRVWRRSRPRFEISICTMCTPLEAEDQSSE
jgi:hypothetical protein